MHKVLPDSGKVGSVMRINGDFLGKTRVDEVYLSDHTFDMKVKVLDQTENSIEFRVPPFVKPGRLQLVLKTAGKEPMILEQPVYVTVEESKEGLEANKTKDAPKETLQATANNTSPAGGTK